MEQGQFLFHNNSRSHLARSHHGPMKLGQKLCVVPTEVHTVDQYHLSRAGGVLVRYCMWPSTHMQVKCDICILYTSSSLALLTCYILPYCTRFWCGTFCCISGTVLWDY